MGEALQEPRRQSAVAWRKSGRYRQVETEGRHSKKRGEPTDERVARQAWGGSGKCVQWQNQAVQATVSEVR